jgi:anti-sigma B factor antagonist
MQEATKITNRKATAVSGAAVSILAFSGDISSASKESILAAYHSVNGATPKILLDFTGIDYINSSGIAIIIQMLLEASKSSAGTIAIFGLSPHFQKVFTMVGIHKYAKLYTGEKEALAEA